MTPDDAVTRESAGKAQADYTKFLDPNGLRGARIGVARKFFGFNEAVDKLMGEALAVMKRLGAEIIDPADIPTTGKFGEPKTKCCSTNSKPISTRISRGSGPKAPVHSLKEIIDFNERNAEREMPYFGQDLMIKPQAKGPLTSPAYLKALKPAANCTRR